MFEVAMINDCAYVGETLLKNLSSDIKWKHVKRSRSLWSKTFGLAYNIMRVKADIYHVHYLLQDCYIAAKLAKKPLIGHAHGSDLRLSLNHPLWGRIVRHNLKKCDKIVVSTPDILLVAKKFREDAEYLPNPVDTELFHPKTRASKGERKSVLIASSSNWSVKGTDIAIRALSMIKDEVNVNLIAYGRDFEKTLALASSLGLSFNVLPPAPHDQLNKYYWDADVVIDQFKSGTIGMISLEAIACGRPVVTYISSKYREYRGFPLLNVNSEKEVAEAVKNADEKLWQIEYNYLEKNHHPKIVIEKLLRIYNEVFK